MNWILWQTTPAIKDSAIEQVRSFFQKLSIPRSGITLIRTQLLGPSMEDLANNLSAQITLELLGDLAVRTAAPEYHAHDCVINSTCCSGIWAGEGYLRIIHATTIRRQALGFPELERDRNDSNIIATRDHIKIIPVHIPLITNRRISASRTIWTSLRRDKGTEEMVPVALSGYDLKLWLVQLFRSSSINPVFLTAHLYHRPTL